MQKNGFNHTASNEQLTYFSLSVHAVSGNSGKDKEG